MPLIKKEFYRYVFNNYRHSNLSLNTSFSFSLVFSCKKTGKGRLEKVKELNILLERTFGLVSQEPEGVYPNLRGKVDGVKIAVDVYMQSYARSEQGRGERPWMRVRAELPSQPNIQVQLRGQKYSNIPSKATGWIEKKEGYPPFDQKHTLFIKEGTSSEEALSPAVREALIAANPPVAILGKVVSWMKKGTEHSPELIRDAVYSCSSVASAIIENS